MHQNPQFSNHRNLENNSFNPGNTHRDHDLISQDNSIGISQKQKLKGPRTLLWGWGVFKEGKKNQDLNQWDYQKGDKINPPYD